MQEELMTKNKEEFEAVQTLAKVVKETCEKIIAQGGFDRTVPGIVLSNQTIDGLVDVQVMGGQYTIHNGSSVIYKEGDSVWITVPCNDINNMFINSIRTGDMNVNIPEIDLSDYVTRDELDDIDLSGYVKHSELVADEDVYIGLNEKKIQTKNMLLNSDGVYVKPLYQSDPDWTPGETTELFLNQFAGYDNLSIPLYSEGIKLVPVLSDIEFSFDSNDKITEIKKTYCLTLGVNNLEDSLELVESVGIQNYNNLRNLELAKADITFKTAHLLVPQKYNEGMLINYNHGLLTGAEFFPDYAEEALSFSEESQNVNVLSVPISFWFCVTDPTSENYYSPTTAYDANGRELIMHPYLNIVNNNSMMFTNRNSITLKREFQTGYLYPNGEGTQFFVADVCADINFRTIIDIQAEEFQVQAHGYVSYMKDYLNNQKFIRGYKSNASDIDLVWDKDELRLYAIKQYRTSGVRTNYYTYRFNVTRTDNGFQPHDYSFLETGRGYYPCDKIVFPYYISSARGVILTVHLDVEPNCNVFTDYIDVYSSYDEIMHCAYHRNNVFDTSICLSNVIITSQCTYVKQIDKRTYKLYIGALRWNYAVEQQYLTSTTYKTTWWLNLNNMFTDEFKQEYSHDGGLLFAMVGAYVRYENSSDSSDKSWHYISNHTIEFTKNY